MLLELLPPELAASRIQIELLQTMSDQAFFEFCVENKHLRIEKTKDGEIIVMSPAGGYSGNRNAKLTSLVDAWADEDDQGIVFDSSTGFALDNGAMRSPDVAWVRKSRLLQLTNSEKTGFIPLAPDFIIELRSASDNLAILQLKMEEWIDNGVNLAWLIDPQNNSVTIYSSNNAPVQLADLSELSGEPILPGFTLNLDRIWNPGF